MWQAHRKCLNVSKPPRSGCPPPPPPHSAAGNVHITARRAARAVRARGLADASTAQLGDDRPVVVDHAHLVDLQATCPQTHNEMPRHQTNREPTAVRCVATAHRTAELWQKRASQGAGCGVAPNAACARALLDTPTPHTHRAPTHHAAAVELRVVELHLVLPHRDVGALLDVIDLAAQERVACAAGHDGQPALVRVAGLAYVLLHALRRALQGLVDGARHGCEVGV